MGPSYPGAHAMRGTRTVCTGADPNPLKKLRLLAGAARPGMAWSLLLGYRPSRTKRIPRMFAVPHAPPPLLRARPSGERTSEVRKVLRRLFAFCLAALVLSGALTAGRTYLWCSMMQASVETCCCGPERATAEARIDERSELRNGCCEDRGHDELDQGRLVSTAIEVPAALPPAACSPLPALAVATRGASLTPASPPCTVRASPIRAGPRAASEICVRLQVFRC